MTETSESNATAWTVHLARAQPRRATVAALLIIAFGVCAALLMDSPPWGVCTAAVLLFSLRRFFLPVHYTIDDRGISLGCAGASSRVRWAQCESFAYDRHGAIVRLRRSRQLTRTIALPFAGDANAVVSALSNHLPTPASKTSDPHPKPSSVKA